MVKDGSEVGCVDGDECVHALCCWRWRLCLSWDSKLMKIGGINDGDEVEWEGRGRNVEVEDEIETDDVGLEEELGRRLGCC